MDDSNIKTILKSLIVADPNQMTVSILNRSFREVEGYDIPYRKLGYSKLEDFLHAIPDCLVVVGSGPHAEVRGKLSSKSAHVAELVANQNVSKTKRRNPRARARHIATENKPKFPPPRFNQNFAPKRDQQVQYNNDSARNINRQQAQYNAHKISQQQARDNLPRLMSNLVMDPRKRETELQTKRPAIIPKFDYQEKSQESQNQYYSQDRSYSPRSSYNSETHLYYGVNSQRTPETTGSSLSSRRKVSSSDYSDSNLSNFDDCPEEQFETKKQTNRCIDGNEIFVSDNECEDTTAEFDFEIFNYKIPFEIQNRLKMLIYPLKDGLWMSKLASTYRSKFGEELDFLDYGYASLTDMILTLENIFNFKQSSNGLLKLYDKSIVPPEMDLYEDFMKLQEGYEEIQPTLNVPAIPENSQINLLSDDSIEIPIDAMKLGETIVKQNLSGFKMHEYIEVCIGEIYDPSKFWFYLNDEAAGKSKLDQLMDEMQEFYATRTKEYEVPRKHLQKGLHCAIKFMDEYHRAIILKFIGESGSFLKAFFFDYGTVSAVPSHGILFLHNTFKTLPMQAMRGRLSRISPRYIHEQWSRQSASRFLQLVKCKVLMAQIDYIEEKRNAYHIVICDTTGPVDVFINDQLVEEKHAIFTSKEQEKNPKIKYKPIVKYLHLFPTYDELELGIVPTATEMMIIMDVPIESIYPQYFEKESTKESDEEKEVSDVNANEYYGSTNKRQSRELKKSLEEKKSLEAKRSLEEISRKDESSLSESVGGVDDKTSDAPSSNYIQISPQKLFGFYNQPQLVPQIPKFPVQRVPEFINNPMLNSPPIVIKPPPGFAPLQPNPLFLLNPQKIPLNPFAPPFQGTNLYFNPQPNMMVYHPQQNHLNIQAPSFKPKQKETYFVTKLNYSGDKIIHSITQENNKFIMLLEINQKLFTTISMTQLKRLVAFNCGANWEIICLLSHPQLKNELIRFDLIDSDCTEIDVITTSTFNKLVNIKL